MCNEHVYRFCSPVSSGVHDYQLLMNEERHMLSAALYNAWSEFPPSSKSNPPFVLLLLQGSSWQRNTQTTLTGACSIKTHFNWDFLLSISTLEARIRPTDATVTFYHQASSKSALRARNYFQTSRNGKEAVKKRSSGREKNSMIKKSYLVCVCKLMVWRRLRIMAWKVVPIYDAPHLVMIGK